MTAPIPPSPDSGLRWTAQTVGMGVEILDRMERAVADEGAVRSCSAMGGWRIL